MNFEIYDTVRLKADLPEMGLKAHAVGVVVAVFSNPNEAYEIEFCNDDGETIAELALLPEQLTKLDP
jgi:hypothetical protein